MLPGSSAESIFRNPEETVGYTCTFIVFQAVFEFVDGVGTDRTVKFAVVFGIVGMVPDVCSFSIGMTGTIIVKPEKSSAFLNVFLFRSLQITVLRVIVF